MLISNFVLEPKIEKNRTGAKAIIHDTPILQGQWIWLKLGISI